MSGDSGIRLTDGGVAGRPESDDSSPVRSTGGGGSESPIDQISTAGGLANPVQQAEVLTRAAKVGAPFVERCPA